MGKGIDLAKSLGPHAQVIDDMKDQLLIALVRRLGGNVAMPVEEINDTGGLLMSMVLEGHTFRFVLEKKQ